MWDECHERFNLAYELIVQTPPVAPVLSIENITFTAIQISWRGARLVFEH